MKIKVLGIQFKFLISLIGSILISILLFVVIANIFPTSNYGRPTYNVSTRYLQNTTNNLTKDLNNTPKTLTNYEKILRTYEQNNLQYKMHFNILDGNTIIYNSSKKNIDFNKAYKNTLKNLRSGDITNHYIFAYKIPVEVGNKVMEIRLTAVPISSEHNDSTFSIFASAAILFISIIITFYLLTLPRMKYINKICCGLNTIAKGNLDFRIEKKGKDELSNIAENINHMSAELQNKIDKERELEDSKQQLITNVAHDIRSPLTSIIGFLELVQNKSYKSEEEMNRFVGISLKKAETMKGLTNDLFMFTKLNNKDLKFNFTTICFNDFIYQMIDEFEPDFEEHFLKFSSEITPEKLFISVDINMFMRAIQNLFSNALKYSLQPSEVKVTLAQENDTAIFSISNMCENVDDLNVDMLFERFYRADKSRFNPDNSSGLGLSITQNIIKKHNGCINAKYDDGIICFSVEMKTTNNAK